jgi:hypothetical protein
MNNNIRNYKRQQKTKRISINPDIEPKDLLDFISELTHSQRRVLNYIIGLDNRYPHIFPTHTRIATACGIARVTVVAIVKSLCSLKLLHYDYRHRKSSIYYIAHYFKNFNIRKELRYVLTALAFLPIWLLHPYSNNYEEVDNYSSQSEYVTPILKRINLHTNIFFSYSSFLTSKPAANVSIEANARARTYTYTRETLNGLPFFQKGVISTMNDKENPISLEIRNLKRLNLSKWGQIKLSCFADEVISEAYSAFLRRKNILDPYRYFFGLCNSICLEKGLVPDVVKAGHLAKIHGMPKDAEMTLGPLLPAEEKKPAKQQYDGPRFKAPTYGPSKIMRQYIDPSLVKRLEQRTFSTDYKAVYPVVTQEVIDNNIKTRQSLQYQEVEKKMLQLLGAELFERCYRTFMPTSWEDVEWLKEQEQKNPQFRQETMSKYLPVIGVL